MFNFDEFFETFSNFYADSIPSNKNPKWIIMSSNRFKIWWDMYITVLLMFLTLVVPVRLAFEDNDPLGWIIAYSIVDVSFLVDIIMTFFTSYTDGYNLEITDHKRIMKNYIKFWFWIDLLSIIPFDYMLSGEEDG